MLVVVWGGDGSGDADGVACIAGSTPVVVVVVVVDVVVFLVRRRRGKQNWRVFILPINFGHDGDGPIIEYLDTGC